MLSRKKEGRKDLQGKKGRSELWDSLREEQCKDPTVGMCVVNINGTAWLESSDHKEKKKKKKIRS